MKMKKLERRRTLERLRLPELVVNKSSRMRKISDTLIDRVEYNERVELKKRPCNAITWYCKPKLHIKPPLDTNEENKPDNSIYINPKQLRHELKKRTSYFAKRNTSVDVVNGREGGDESFEEERRRRRAEALTRFMAMIERVRTLLRVFRQMRMYAIEKGQHMRDIGTVITEKEENDSAKRDLLFDVDDYKCKYRFCIPKWVQEVCSLSPEERSKTDIQNLVQLMQSLKAFRKYSLTEQELIAMTVRYEKFGRRRVVIRKGHIGTAFYMIYSGSVAVVADGDEDVPFVEGYKSNNIMKQGDSFGELALVKSAARSATVVCLEKTEFFVVDSESFFKFGIDAFSKDEIEYRHSCVKALDFFKDVDEVSCRQIAEECREITYLTDKVIEPDSANTDFVYFVTKGRCYVLRLLDLEAQENILASGRARAYTDLTTLTASSRNNESRETCSSNQCPLLPFVSPNPCSASTFADRHTSRNNQQQNSFIELGKDFSQRKECSVASHAQNSCSLYNKRSRMQTHKRKTTDEHPYIDHHLVYLKMEVLTAGRSFGLQQIVDKTTEEDETRDTRKFILVSSGCQVIRIPAKLLHDIANDAVLKKIRSMVVNYPSDEQLYAEFKCFDDWCCFRENLVQRKMMRSYARGRTRSCLQ